MKLNERTKVVFVVLFAITLSLAVVVHFNDLDVYLLPIDKIFVFVYVTKFLSIVDVLQYLVHS